MSKYRDQLLEDVEARIKSDLAHHVITLLRSDGMYRHWRCGRPKSSNCYFDIVTWPGHLCYTGDMGTFLFARTEDMVEFMRTACMDCGYAAEKCLAHEEPLREWHAELFHETLDAFLVKHPEHKKAIAEIRSEFDEYEMQHDAERAMYESGLWDELPDCRAYTFRFLWCLKAITWFCERVPKQAVVAS